MAAEALSPRRQPFCAVLPRGAAPYTRGGQKYAGGEHNGRLAMHAGRPLRKQREVCVCVFVSPQVPAHALYDREAHADSSPDNHLCVSCQQDSISI